MSSAAELEDVLTLDLEQAAEAAAEGDDARSVHLIETAGHALAAVYVNAPMWCPALVAELGDRSPRVRPGDLRAACAVAADDIDERTGDRPVLLHPDVITWVVEAVKLHRADVDGLLAACCVICPWSLDELTFMIDWYEDLLASALLVVGLRHDDGEPVLVSTESRDWYGYRADLRHAGFGHLADDRDGAYLRWVQTRNGTRILRENLEIEERGGSLDDVDMTYSAPSAVVADLFREVER